MFFLQMEPLKLLIERLNYKHLLILNPNEIERDRPNFSTVPFKFNLVWSMFRVDHMKLKKSIVLPLSLGAMSAMDPTWGTFAMKS